MLLVVLAFVLHRLMPRRRMPWTIPLVVVGVLVTVRTVTWVAGE